MTVYIKTLDKIPRPLYVFSYIVLLAAATTKKKAKVSTPILQIEEEEEEIAEELSAYTAATTFERKPSLMERIRNSKLVRAATYLFRIKIRIELPNALPEGRGDY